MTASEIILVYQLNPMHHLGTKKQYMTWFFCIVISTPYCRISLHVHHRLNCMSLTFTLTIALMITIVNHGHFGMLRV